jgi:hypothetical protein
MSAKAVAFFGRVARTGALKPNARAVLQHLAWSHSHLKPNSLRMSMEDIGWKIGMLPSTVHRSIHELIDLGVLKDEPRKAKRDKTAYTFPTGWDIEGSGEQYLAGIRAVGKAKRKAKERKEQRQSEQAKEAVDFVSNDGLSYSHPANANNGLSYSHPATKKGLSYSHPANASKQVKANGAINAPKLSEFSDDYSDDDLTEFDGWNDEAWREKMNAGETPVETTAPEGAEE